MRLRLDQEQKRTETIFNAAIPFIGGVLRLINKFPTVLALHTAVPQVLGQG